MADPSVSPFLVVGLGNPGAEYEKTRHNVGFEVIDELASRCGGAAFARKFHALSAQVNRGQGRVLLMKPQTYMNRSGLAVGEAVSFFKIDPALRLLVISDDLDLPLETIRLRLGGGSGGHNGLKSIIQAVGGETFPRLRLGIGRPQSSGTEGYVLSKIPKAERSLYDEVIQRAADAVERILEEGATKAMNTVNRKGKNNES